MSDGSKFIPLLFIIGGALIAFGFSGSRLIAPVRGKVSSRFGTRVNPITKKKEFHNGIDIAVPEGTGVRSAGSGVIANVYTSDIGGVQMILRLDSGMVAGYAHLQKAKVRKGDRVGSGQVIALSGRSGKVTGSHLHFSLRDKSGEYINPERAVKI